MSIYFLVYINNFSYYKLKQNAKIYINPFGDNSNKRITSMFMKNNYFQTKTKFSEKIDIYISQIFLMFGLIENNWILHVVISCHIPFGKIPLYTRERMRMK